MQENPNRGQRHPELRAAALGALGGHDSFYGVFADDDGRQFTIEVHRNASPLSPRLRTLSEWQQHGREDLGVEVAE